MSQARYIVFSRITSAEFYNIYKPRGATVGGGGQTYLDIPTSVVSPSDWREFFSEVEPEDWSHGPGYSFTIRSLGTDVSQKLTIKVTRRVSSFSITHQNINTRNQNRVEAWRPERRFPIPTDPWEREIIEDLVIYIVKTEDYEYWAGFFHQPNPNQEWYVDENLSQMFDPNVRAGIIRIDYSLSLNASDNIWPFYLAEGEAVAVTRGEGIGDRTDGESELTDGGEPESRRKSSKQVRGRHGGRTEDEIIRDLFDNDTTVAEEDPQTRKVINRVRVRNQRAIRDLKILYQGRCQISGGEYTFLKRNGEPYLEAHHLIPLGEGGADHPYNIIVVSPLIHQMLHHADVSEIMLNDIVDNQLSITINGEEHTISWHPEHARVIEEIGVRNN